MRLGELSGVGTNRVIGCNVTVVISPRNAEIAGCMVTV